MHEGGARVHDRQKALAWCAAAASLVVSFAGCSQESPTAAERAATTSSGDAGAAGPAAYLDRPMREQVAALESGAVTSAGLTAGYLARIASHDQGDGGVHAVIVTDPQAIAHAGALDAERARKAPLQGASILVKDNVDTKGIATTAGSLALANNVPVHDAFVVQRLREAHGLMLGKTNLSEWANFRSSKSTSGWSSVGGQTRMGRNTAYDPCGSSSGSAAAIAAGFASAAIGSETDGSIVCPASVNGVVGFKPTVGLVSRAGVVPIAASQDTLGPITRTVGDAARILSVIAGPDPDDLATRGIPAGMSLDFEGPLAGATLRGKRLGVVVSFGFGLETNLFDSETARMQKAGATIVNVTMDVDSWGDDELTILLYEFKAGIDAYLGRHPIPGQAVTLADLIAFDSAHADTVMPFFGQELFTMAEATSGLSAPAYLAARGKAQLAARQNGIDAALARDHLDALITPTWDPAWVIDYETGDPANGHGASSPAAVAGYPHLTVPMGTVDGLPVGMSFFASAWQDAAVLALGYAYEQLE